MWDGPISERVPGRTASVCTHKKYDPDYIWAVDNHKDYPRWVFRIPKDPVGVKGIFEDVFGKGACNLYEKDMKRIKFMFNKRDVSYKKDFVYSSDVRNLVENIHGLTENREVAKRTLFLAATGFYDKITEKLDSHMLNDENDLVKFLDYLKSSSD